MKKNKLIALILALAMTVFVLAACSEKEDPNVAEIGDFKAAFVSHEVVTDADGDDAVILTFDYTNNSEETETFYWSMWWVVEQDGSELPWSVVWLDTDSFIAVDDSLHTDVDPGNTAEVQMTYKLNDLTTPIEITFSDLAETEEKTITVELEN